jgi:hypothetical protein
MGAKKKSACPGNMIVPSIIQADIDALRMQLNETPEYEFLGLTGAQVLKLAMSVGVHALKVKHNLADAP